MDRLESITEGLVPASKLQTHEETLGRMASSVRRKRLQWGTITIKSTKACQNHALQALEALESPLVRADPACDGAWIVRHLGRIKRTRAWAAITRADTGDALWKSWDDYCYGRWGRSGSWFRELLRKESKCKSKTTN